MAGAPAGDADTLKDLRAVLGSFMSGVTIVTTLDADGAPRGLTASSFTSVSLDPPLVLVCVANTAESFAAFRDTAEFTINILDSEQGPLAKRFATRGADKFAGVEHRAGVLSSPTLDGAIASLECTLFKSYQLGDHLVLVGSVVSARHTEDAEPLGYFRGKFHLRGDEIGRADVEEQEVSRTEIAWIFEGSDGRIALTRSDAGSDEWSLPSSADFLSGMRDEWNILSLTRNAARALFGTDSPVPRLYSVYNESKLSTLLIYRVRLASTAEPIERVGFFDASDLPWPQIPDWYVRNALRRYFYERSTDEYGIFVGTAEGGVVEVGPQALSWQDYSAPFAGGSSERAE